MSFATFLTILAKKVDARHLLRLKAAEVFLGFVVAAPMSAMGQADLQTNCAALINQTRTESRIIVTEKRFGEHIKNFCDEHNTSDGSSRSHNYGVSYKFLGLSSEGRKLSHNKVFEKYCEDTRQTTEDSSDYEEYITSIPPKAFEAYNNCLQMGEKGVTFFPTDGSVSETIISVPLRFNALQGSGVKGRRVSADVTSSDKDNVSCMWVRRVGEEDREEIPGDVGMHIKNDQQVNFYCERKNFNRRSTIQMTSDVNFSMVLDWPAFVRVGNEYEKIDHMKAMENRINGLEQELSSLRENGLVRIESGIVTILDAKADVQEPIEGQIIRYVEGLSGGQDVRGIKGEVEFEFPFLSTPKVVMAIQLISSDAGTNTKLSVGPVSIGKKGFTYSFFTWDDSNVLGASAMWLAYGK